MGKEIIGWHHPNDEADQWDGFNDSGIEHFAGNPIRHLAREIHQNSLDSAETKPGSNEKEVVRVVIRHFLVDPGEIPNVDSLKKTVDNCKIAAKKESEKAQQFFETAASELNKKKISVLEISDFNTRGMRGPAENGTPYFAFMKAKGQSRKESATATGSFGIGKYAPYAVSKLRTVFVSTVYQDDESNYHQLTQGKSILMSHDVVGKRKQGAGFWGAVERCQPVAGVRVDLPSWIQRADTAEKLSQSKGTKLTILAFDAAPGWQESLATSVAENFFGAIDSGKLEVEIEGFLVLNKNTIIEFFANSGIKEAICKQKYEPEQFENCGNYLASLQESTEIYKEESEQPLLGLCEMRILINEGLPKKVCFLRNGMFISDSLSQPGLKSFSDFKEFVAVIECKNKSGIELLRAMEPPRHDDFEPARLSNREEQRRGARALKELAQWIRAMLKRHAQNPVSEVTMLDELKEYFADDSGEGGEKGTEEIDPYGKIIIRAKPVKHKASATNLDAAGDTGNNDGGTGGGGSDGTGGGYGAGGNGSADGGNGGGNGVNGNNDNGGQANDPKPHVLITNIRAVIGGSKLRKISFTPAKTGPIALSVMEAGADTDYAVAITSSNEGTIKDGKVVLDAKANSRLSIEVGLAEEFSGAVKVVAHEV